MPPALAARLRFLPSFPARLTPLLLPAGSVRGPAAGASCADGRGFEGARAARRRRPPLAVASRGCVEAEAAGSGKARGAAAHHPFALRGLQWFHVSLLSCGLGTVLRLWSTAPRSRIVSVSPACLQPGAPVLERPEVRPRCQCRSSVDSAPALQKSAHGKSERMSHLRASSRSRDAHESSSIVHGTNEHADGQVVRIFSSANSK